MSGRNNDLVAGVEGVLPGETATARAAHASLKGERKGLRALWPFLGPAFVAAVAYVDPGNFATNISAGAQFGYLLLWVILCSNLMAMLIQSMSAKLGIATGKNLPEVCRERFPRPLTLILWLQAELIAMATDLAEFIGAALALNLPFGIPLLPAGLLTGVGSFGILALKRRGFRPLEAVVSSLIGVIILGFAFQMFYAQPEADRILAGLLLLVLSALGNVFGRGANFEVENDTHYCKINVVLVGESAKARKGTAQGRVNRLISRVDPIWANSCCVTGLSSGEGLIHRVRDGVVRENKDGEIMVVDEGVADKRLLVEEPEFASPLTVMQRNGNTLSMVARSAWDDRALQTLTKTSGERSTGSHVTIVGHITKKELLKHLTEEKLGSGIANRFAFALVRRSKRLPHGGAEDAFDTEQIQALERALEFGKTHRRIDLSDEIEEGYGYSAKELWEEIYEDLSEGKPGLFGAVVSRAEAQVRRLATVYAALDLSHVVRVPHLLAALAVWQYAELSAYLIFGDRTGDMVADEILEALREAGEEGMSRTEIHDLFGRHLKGRLLGAILRDLEAQGRIYKKKLPKVEGPGRPPEVWCIRDE